MNIVNTSDYSLISELCDALKDATEPTSLLVGDQVVIVTPAEKATEQIDLAAMRAEVASVLEQLDELALADLWGHATFAGDDEAVFRRCRDRLRALIENKN